MVQVFQSNFSFHFKLNYGLNWKADAEIHGGSQGLVFFHQFPMHSFVHVCRVLLTFVQMEVTNIIETELLCPHLQPHL